MTPPCDPPVTPTAKDVRPTVTNQTHTSYTTLPIPYIIVTGGWVHNLAVPKHDLCLQVQKTCAPGVQVHAHVTTELTLTNTSVPRAWHRSERYKKVVPRPGTNELCTGTSTGNESPKWVQNISEIEVSLKDLFESLKPSWSRVPGTSTKRNPCRFLASVGNPTGFHF